MSVATTRRRGGRAATAEVVAGIEASELHLMLATQGFRLQPFRLPSGLHRGKHRVRVTWKKESDGDTLTVRFTHTVAAPAIG